MKRIAITGSSGYLGSGLIRYFSANQPQAKILGLDIVPPRDRSGHDFLRLDMCQPEFAVALKKFRPDTVVHAAFIVAPMHNERKMRRINVEGSRSVLAATAAAGAERLLVTSSATVLGARPDNPVPMDDAWPGRAGPEFAYAAHKVELEEMVGQFAKEHPKIAVSCLRPCIVAGPNMDNYLRHLIMKMPIIVLLDRVDSTIQLVHEEDVFEAVYRILVHRGTGVYNLAAPDTISLTDLSELSGRPRISAPFWLGRVLAWIAWKTHFPPHKYPPGFLYFLRYPWLVASNRLTNELGFQFHHSTRETYLEMLECDNKARGGGAVDQTAPLPHRKNSLPANRRPARVAGLFTPGEQEIRGWWRRAQDDRREPQMSHGITGVSAPADAVADVSKIFERIRIPAANRYVSVRQAEGEVMHRWVKDHGLNRTLEVGLAYGASACCIASAHEGRHTCMDPFQENEYSNLGLENLTSMGLRSRTDFHPTFSYAVLPQLVAAKRRFDFAFIDGNHLYDGIFLDFFYVDLLLDEQGYVLFHDAWMRGTQLVASFIEQNRKDYRRVSCPAKNLILFQKIGKDERPWHHFRGFYTWKSLFSHPIICWMMRMGILQRLLVGNAAAGQENKS